MIGNNTVLAVIPARGGSKSIPKKNIVDLGGKPLIFWSIHEAKKSKYIDRIICSTDNEEIAAIAKKYGAEIPFMRPEHLSEDHTLDLPVFQHVLETLKKTENYKPDFIVQLRPTSPLRTVDQIDRAIELLAEDEEADSVRGVCQAEQTPYKMWKIDGNYISPLLQHETIKEPYNTLRQLLPPVFWQNGYIEVIRYDTLMKKNSMTGNRIIPLVINDEDIVDIDGWLNLRLAEQIMEKRK